MLKIDIGRVKSDAKYREAARRENNRQAFLVLSVILASPIVAGLSGEIQFVGYWLALMTGLVLLCSLAGRETPLATFRSFVKMYSAGLQSFRNKS